MLAQGCGHPAPRALLLPRGALLGLMASSPTESPQQRERIAVRHGASLAHCADPEVAARLMLSLQRLPRAAAGRTGMDGTEIVEAAILATRLLGSETVARGLALLRCAGRRMPGHLARDLRALDAAAALLRHPGAAQRVVTRLEAWLAGVASADEPSRDGSEDDGDALVGAGRSSDASPLPSAHRGAETCTEADSVDVAGADAGAGAAHRQRSLEEFGFVQHVQATGETGPTDEQPSDVPVAASCFDIYDSVREAAVQTDAESTTTAFDDTVVRDEHVAGSAPETALRGREDAVVLSCHGAQPGAGQEVTAEDVSNAGRVEPGVGDIGNLASSAGSKGLSKRAKKRAVAVAKAAVPSAATSPAAEGSSPLNFAAMEVATAVGGASPCGNAWAGCGARDEATVADAQQRVPPHRCRELDQMATDTADSILRGKSEHAGVIIKELCTLAERIVKHSMTNGPLTHGDQLVDDAELASAEAEKLFALLAKGTRLDARAALETVADVTTRARGPRDRRALKIALAYVGKALAGVLLVDPDYLPKPKDAGDDNT